MSATLQIDIVESGEGIKGQPDSIPQPATPAQAPQGVPRSQIDNSSSGIDADAFVTRIESIGRDMLAGMRDPSIKELVQVSKRILAIMVGRKLGEVVKEKIVDRITGRQREQPSTVPEPTPGPTVQPEPRAPQPAKPTAEPQRPARDTAMPARRSFDDMPSRTVEGKVKRVTSLGRNRGEKPEQNRPTGLTTFRQSGVSRTPPKQLPAVVRPQVPTPIPGTAVPALAGLSTTAIAVTGGLAAAAVAAGVAVAAVNKWSAAMRREADALAQFSASLALEKSVGEINMVLAKLDRSQRIEGNLSTLSRQQMRYDELSYRAQTEFYAASLQVYKLFDPFVEAGLDFFEDVIDTMENNKEAVDLGIRTAITAVAPGLSQMLFALEKMAQKDEDAKAFINDPVLQSLERMLTSVSRQAPKKGQP